MCGRYTHKFTWQELHDLLAKGKWPARLAEVANPELFDPRFNVAPTQNAPVIRAVATPDGKVSGIEVSAMRWGLVPHWAKDAKSGPINARAETVATNGMFRTAFASRRCVVPVSGFYEWHQTKSEALMPGAPSELGPKVPFFISRADGAPALLAGLWSRWGSGTECVDTFTIITTAANAFMSRVHDRVPVVLEPESVPDWLDPQAKTDTLLDLLRPAADGVLQMHEVSTRVNSPKNDGPELIVPA